MGKIKLCPQRTICLLTGLASGFLIGITLLVFLVSYRIDEYYERIIYLETQLEDKNTQLRQLEKSINKSKPVLEEIEVNLELNQDQLDELTLKKYVAGKYVSLIGKEIESIDINLALEIINDRICRLEEKEYRLCVNKMVLSNKLQIWVSVEQL